MKKTCEQEGLYYKIKETEIKPKLTLLNLLSGMHRELVKVM
ncbi:hypothetical protein AGMMS49573_11060 [Endomicrobiia bacterium]|nr:hypothetical protein AGMMS49573_11060 [Endomicrobiia bacterium]